MNSCWEAAATSLGVPLRGLLLTVYWLQFVLLLILDELNLFLFQLLPEQAVASLGVLPILLSVVVFTLGILHLLALQVPQLHQQITDEVILIVLFGVACVQVVVASYPLAGRVVPCQFLAEAWYVAGPFYYLQQRSIAEVEYAVVVELDLEVLLHELVDVLDLVEGEPLEHPKPVGIVEHVKGCSASQHLHCLEFAGVHSVVGVLVEGVQD